jgi:hypothetical protein
MMATLDEFMAETKVIRGVEAGYSWKPGYTPHEVVADFPLEVAGEMHGAKLSVVGFPRATELKFRLMVCFNAAICRLDYTDETHPNTLVEPFDLLKPLVDGPHYHSWPLNRRFFRGVTTANKLHLAEEFTNSARTFDSILRWFCSDTKIVGLPPNHMIHLPRPDRFL